MVLDLLAFDFHCMTIYRIWSSFKNGIITIVIPDNMELLKREPETDRLSLLGSGETNEALIITHWEEEFKSVLQKHEIPKAIICLVDGPWTPETGLVTGAMKIKRQKIQEHYQAKVDKLFNQINLAVCVFVDKSKLHWTHFSIIVYIFFRQLPFHKFFN